MSDHTTDSDLSAMGPALFKQACDLWIEPEITRRRAAGTLDVNSKVERFQIVMHVDRPHQVRLNDEIRGLMKARVRGPVQAGDPATMDSISEITEFDVTAADPNAGHITAIFVPCEKDSHWALFFDFRYNSQRVRETLEAAREFLSVAEDALRSARLRATTENLFTALELTAKATLMLLPDERILAARTHARVGSLFNVFARNGNVDSEFKRALNVVSQLRPAARYPDRKFETSAADLDALLVIGSRFIEHVTAQNYRLSHGQPGAST